MREHQRPRRRREEEDYSPGYVIVRLLWLPFEMLWWLLQGLYRRVCKRRDDVAEGHRTCEVCDERVDLNRLVVCPFCRFASPRSVFQPCANPECRRVAPWFNCPECGASIVNPRYDPDDDDNS